MKFKLLVLVLFVGCGAGVVEKEEPFADDYCQQTWGKCWEQAGSGARVICCDAPVIADGGGFVPGN